MRCVPGLLALALLGVLLPPWGGAAWAETRRVAVLVGHNAGSGERPPLRFAETDAGKLASVLQELGSVAPADLLVVQGQGLSALQEALAQASRRVAAWRATPGTRVVLLFYFSGHSDGASLELGRERLAFGELRRWLDATRADLRLAIVDACRSGALLRVKGGRPGPSFDIRLADELQSRGEALLTSSAEDELALESGEVGGSFFTHHLVSGLRGAADLSGDGRVTLAEAYQYAYGRTVMATAVTLTGTQHPAYAYALHGEGELVLTQLDIPGAALELPEGHERALVIHPARQQVLAELAPGARQRLALPPGEYAVHAWRAGRPHGGRVHVGAGQVRQVRWDELLPGSAPLLASKGSELPGGLALGMALGVRRALASGLSPLPMLHLSARGAGHSGPLLALELASRARASVREDAAQLALGYRWGTAWGALEGAVGAEVAAQYVRQSRAGEALGWSLTPSVGPSARLGLRLSRALGVELEGRLPAGRVVRDGVGTLVLLPSVHLGVAWRRAP